MISVKSHLRKTHRGKTRVRRHVRLKPYRIYVEPQAGYEFEIVAKSITQAKAKAKKEFLKDLEVYGESVEETGWGRRSHLKKRVRVMKRGITFHEYENIADALEKLGAKMIDSFSSYVTKRESSTWKINDVTIKVGASSLFEGGEIVVHAPSRKQWKTFLQKNPSIKKLLPLKGSRIIWIESEERWVRR